MTNKYRQMISIDPASVEVENHLKWQHGHHHLAGTLVGPWRQ